MTDAALVTGSTSGIGAAFANKLAKEKNHLVLVSRNKDKLEAQSNALSKKYKIQVFTIACDLARTGAAQQIFERVQELNLQIQILINNAGFNECGCFLKTDGDKELEMISLHTIFVTEMMKLFLPVMVCKGYGRVLNVGSTGSYIACPYDAVYAATKAYILSVSKGINAELKGTGVTVTTLCPGSTKTEFASKANMENTPLFKRFVMKPELVAKIGYRALMKGKTSVIAGLRNKLLVFSSYLLPDALLNFFSKKMLSEH